MKHLTKARPLVVHDYIYRAVEHDWPVGDVTMLLLPNGVRVLPYAEMLRLNGIVVTRLKDRSTRTAEEEVFITDWEFEQP